ncbi:lipopolysaccharide assembly protein LapA domain-containing protein [Pseudomonas corrugata]|uniref:lipopolysaccharide assembly protein LapA domain-containing protein n=1 Tax=Pseudomonas corrugata TaxID=47879 RepID=UPI0028C4B745|nr:lipopolysaccharide assembly protein LapA domain-containing protein [Pseudomonas corrugata]MDU9033935.1 lipopolysaccharide assembly protein LapA domain-containing protein [Pseudomonas corrugata]
MRNFKRLALIALALLLGSTIVLFVLENTQPVALLFLGWSAPQLPVSVFLLLALLAGMMLGPLLAWYMAARRRLK